MKKLLSTFALAAMAAFADAQGTIQLANSAGTRFRINGVIPANSSAGGPAGGTFSFGVFVGLTADSLSCDPVLPLGTNSSTGGLISGPNAGAYPIPGHAPGSTVFIQIRGWESRFASWETGQQGLHAQTSILPFVLGPESLAPGTVIWSATDPTKFNGMNSSVGPVIPDPCVPEPSAIALVGLGLASLLLLRRRR